MDDSVFSRPPEEWTDDEIRVGLAEVAALLEFYTAAGDASMVEFFHGVAVVLAEHRDARAALYRAIEAVPW